MKTEAHVKTAVKEYLKPLAPFFWFFMPVSMGFGVHGIPDFVCCYRGQFVVIETKRPGRRGEANEGLSALQVRVKDFIIRSGGKYFTIDDQETLDDFAFWINCCEEAIADARNIEDDLCGAEEGRPQV